VPVVLIAGNHDSPGRLGFAARVLRGQGLYVRAWPEDEPEPIVLSDAHGPVYVVPLPFAELSVLRERLSGDPVRDHDAGLRALLRRARAAVPRGSRAVLLAHALVAGGTPSESERPLQVGGAGRVGAGRFRGFDYVALGHLHRSQQVGSPRVHYSGSLLKYSFEESAHPKSVNVVDLAADGACTIERVVLSPRRDVRCVRGELADLLAGDAASGGSADDYLHVTLLDRAPAHDALGRLREVYPNVLQLEHALQPDAPDVARHGDHRRLGEPELFARFFAAVTGDELNEAETRAFADALERFRSRQREAAP
jgi:exonuclease SbcD